MDNWIAVVSKAQKYLSLTSSLKNTSNTTPTVIEGGQNARMVWLASCVESFSRKAKSFVICENFARAAWHAAYIFQVCVTLLTCFILG